SRKYLFLPLQFLKSASSASVTQPSSLSVLVIVDSLNFKKDSEFMGITVLFLDEKMWLGKSVLSRALTLPKKQLESLSVSSLIHVVGQIRSVQGSNLTKETTRVLIRLLIDP
ncbi:hypothetical protein HID58_041379, partial [Brassica napus]